MSYRRAIALEPGFLWAHVSLAHAFFRRHEYTAALEMLETAAAESYSPRLFMDTWSVHSCDVPLMLSKALYYHYLDGGEPRAAIRRHKFWPKRSALLRAARQACGFAEPKVHDAEALMSYWKQARAAGMEL